MNWSHADMLSRYLFALLLTLIIEGCIAYLLGLRKGQYMLAIAMINVITHIILNYLILVLRYLSIDVTLGVVIILEILVVISEWQLLVYVFCDPKGRFLSISILGNTLSFLVGWLLFWI